MPKANDAVFLALVKRAKLPRPVPEYRFHDTRKWRFDYAFPAERVALEIEGGAFVGGRHTRGAGFVKDLEKYSHAAALGWRIVRVTPSQLCTEQTITYLKDALHWRVEPLT